MDYCFLRNREGAEAVPTLVLKDKDTGALAAHAVPYKGGDSEWVVDQVCRDIQKWGIKGEVILRHDQENALRDLSKEVTTQREAANLSTHFRQFEEESPVGESRSNGYTDSGVRTLEGILRTHKFALEERLQVKVDTGHPIFGWLVEHSVDLVTKFQVGEDGLTAYQRLKKRPYNGEVLDFGTRVWHRVPGKPRGGDMRWRWLEGTWVGTRFHSNEHVVIMDDGRAVRARAVQAFPVETRWDKEKVMAITARPWSPTGTVRRRPDEEQEVPHPAQEAEGQDPAPVQPRGMPVLRQHLTKFGYTDRCLKCRMIRTGDTSRPSEGHSKACRERIREESMRDLEFAARAKAGLARTGKR